MRVRKGRRREAAAAAATIARARLLLLLARDTNFGSCLSPKPARALVAITSWMATSAAAAAAAGLLSLGWLEQQPGANCSPLGLVKRASRAPEPKFTGAAFAPSGLSLLESRVRYAQLGLWCQLLSNDLRVLPLATP